MLARRAAVLSDLSHKLQSETLQPSAIRTNALVFNPQSMNSIARPVPDSGVFSVDHEGALSDSRKPVR
jgi:hypothetical protein